MTDTVVGAGVMSELTEADKETLGELADAGEPWSEAIAAYLHAIEATE